MTKQRSICIRLQDCIFSCLGSSDHVLVAEQVELLQPLLPQFSIARRCVECPGALDRPREVLPETRLGPSIHAREVRRQGAMAPAAAEEGRWVSTPTKRTALKRYRESSMTIVRETYEGERSMTSRKTAYFVEGNPNSTHSYEFYHRRTPEGISIPLAS